MRINGGESCFNPGSSRSVGTTCIYKMKWKRTDVVDIIKGASYIELHEVRHPTVHADGNYTTYM